MTIKLSAGKIEIGVLLGQDILDGWVTEEFN